MTVTVQLAFTARVPPLTHAPPVVNVNCPGFAPFSVNPLAVLNVSGAAPVLVTVTVAGAEVVPRVTLPKLYGVTDVVAGVTVAAGKRTLPVSVTDFETAGALTFTFTDALFVSGGAVVGVKVTLIVHVPPAARPPLATPIGQLLVTVN